VVDHHTSGRDSGAGAALVRKALEHVPAERLILARTAAWARRHEPRHAFYKMCRSYGERTWWRERKLLEAACLAADERFSMVEEANDIHRRKFVKAAVQRRRRRRSASRRSCAQQGQPIRIGCHHQTGALASGGIDMERGLTCFSGEELHARRPRSR